MGCEASSTQETMGNWCEFSVEFIGFKVVADEETGYIELRIGRYHWIARDPRILHAPIWIFGWRLETHSRPGIR